MAENNTELKAYKINDSTVVDIANGKKKVVPKGKKKKKEKKGGRKAIAILAVLLILGGGVAAAFAFNLFGLPGSFYEFAHNLDPAYRALSEKEAELSLEDKRLTAYEETLDALQARLDAEERALQEQAAEVESARSRLNPVYWPPVSEEDAAFMKNVAKIYAAMEPDNAADVMGRLYDIEDMAAIIYYMKQDAAAAILENMSAVTAAQITDALLRG